jgi:hypothetical protein
LANRVDTAKRRNLVAKTLAEGKGLKTIASETGLSYNRVRKDVKKIMSDITKPGLTELEVWRQEHISELQDLKDDLYKLKEKYPADLKIYDRLLAAFETDVRLKGTAAPSKSHSLNLNLAGPQLDSLYLDIRRLLLDADEETRQLALESVSSIVKANKKTIVIDAMPLKELGQ